MSGLWPQDSLPRSKVGRDVVKEAFGSVVVFVCREFLLLLLHARALRGLRTIRLVRCSILSETRHKRSVISLSNSDLSNILKTHLRPPS